MREVMLLFARFVEYKDEIEETCKNTEEKEGGIGGTTE